jgi:2-polyprenyl-3-methyl-5-hydroxy-6-metoxy-1,4-benzoquinol methylase
MPNKAFNDIVYTSYRSAFKGKADALSLAFGASKLQPLIEPWLRDVPRDRKVIDLGCGAGELMLAFKILGFVQLFGCDLSEQQIEVAKTVTPDVRVMNLFDYLAEFPDESIGIVTLFDVIEHLEKQHVYDLFRLVKSKLIDNGLMIAHTPNGLSPFVGHVYFGDLTHEWCPTPASVRTMLNLSGFRKFEAAEHLGASNHVLGRIRLLAWEIIRWKFILSNLIETGSKGEGVWTRNFAFVATK